MALPVLQKIPTHFLRLDTMQSFMAKVGVPVLVTSVTLTGLVLGLRHVGWMQGAELAAYDRFVQVQPDQGPDHRLLVVGIDEADLQSLKAYPISDRTLAQLIQRLDAHHPRAIGVDVARDLPIAPGRAELLKLLQKNDRVILVCQVNSAREFGFAPPPGIPLNKVGSADLPIDPGGILRRTLLSLEPPASGVVIKKNLCSDPNNTVLSFSFNLALTYLEALHIAPTITPSQEIKLGSVILPKFKASMGGYRQADDKGHQMLLRYRSRDHAAVRVRLTDVLNGNVAPELIRDRIVLIGYTAPQVKDDFYTPYSSDKDDLQKMPGVVVHAQAISQILSAVLDRQPLIWVWSPWAEMGWILGWSLVGGILAWYIRHPFWFSVVIVGVSSTIYGLSLLLFFQGGWIPIVPAIATFISTAVGVVLFDRFNNSSYGQTVYKTVKTFLKLEVEIDEEKLEKQVAEITETDYFRNLQDTVKSLREQQQNPPPVSAQNADDYELDFVQQLKQESQQLKANLPPPSDDQNTLDAASILKPGNKYLGTDSLPPQQLNEPPNPPPSRLFRLDDHLIPPQEEHENLDYLEELQQQSQRFKKARSEEEKW